MHVHAHIYTHTYMHTHTRTYIQELQGASADVKITPTTLDKAIAYIKAKKSKLLLCYFVCLLLACRFALEAVHAYISKAQKSKFLCMSVIYMDICVSSH